MSATSNRSRAAQRRLEPRLGPGPAPRTPPAAVLPARLAEPQRRLAVRDRPRRQRAGARPARPRPLRGPILVPFCPRATASGIGKTDFMEAVWYRRTVPIPAEWVGPPGAAALRRRGPRRHRLGERRRGGAGTAAGSAPSPADITAAVAPGGDADIVVRARDTRGPSRPRGKQSRRVRQPRLRLHPHHRDLADGVAGGGARGAPAAPRVTPETPGPARSRSHAGQWPTAPGWTARATLADARGVVAAARPPGRPGPAPTVTLVLPADRRAAVVARRPASLRPDAGTCATRPAALVDQVQSYAGLAIGHDRRQGDQASTVSRYSSGWCSTRATIRTAS